MPDSPAVRRVAMTHPEVGSGELWLDPAGSVAAWLGRLPCHPPFARILPVDGPLGRGTFVEGGLELSLAALPAPLPRAAALYVAQELAEDCARLHEAGGGHGAMSPRTLGWTRDGRLLVGPDPELMAAAAHAEGVQVRDCQAIGAALWCALGGVWPLPEEERNPARLLSPGLPRIVIDTLPRLCADDDRLELLLRGLLRWGGGYRMAPARAVRQAVSALRIRHAAAEEALAAYLANSHIRWRPREERPMPRYSPPPPEALPPPDDAAVAEAEAAPEPPEAEPPEAEPPEAEPPEAEPPEAEPESEAEVEPARRTAEVESVAPPEPEPEAVPEPEALLEPEPEAVPEPEAEVEPARRTAENEVEPARRTAEPETLLTRSRAPDSAAWLEGVGVTSGSDRDRELGPGKWTEPARSLDEVRAALDAVPIPRADPPPPAPRRPLLLAAAALVVAMLGGLGWWIDRVHRHPAGTVVPVAAPPVPQENAWVDASPAASDAPIATVRAEMAGAVIRLDGRAFGPSPARVLVPLDPGRHELCAEAGERRVCRSVTGEELASHEPFLLSADGSP